MKLGLSIRERRTIFIGGALAVFVFWLYSVYLVAPLMKEAAEIGEQVRMAQDQLRALEAVMAKEAVVQAQHRQATETVRSLRNLLPAEEELPSVIELLSNLAGQAQVKIQTIFPQRPVPAEKGESEEPGKDAAAGPLIYKDVIIQIDAQAGYHQLGTFLSLIESSKKPMEVASLRMSADPNDPQRHIIKLLIRSYFATK